MIVGIDLGTTNSLIGAIENGRPKLFADDNGSNLVPSVVYYGEDKTRLVGHRAQAKRATEVSHTLFSAKRFLGRGKKDVLSWMELLPFDFSPSDDQMVRFRVGTETVNPIEVAAQILKHLKTLATSQTGQSISKAVVTVPAYFNDAQRQATKFAGQLAGLEVIRILNEPTAACLAYGLDKKAMGNIAVFDLGGGTFDISILKVKDGVFEVLATNGDTSLGGDDFDHAIAIQLASRLQTLGFANPLESRETRDRLVREAQLLKHGLSEKEESLFQWQENDQSSTFTVTRNEVETWMTPVLERVLAPCKQCLEDSGLKAIQIHDVVLVGGSTRSPLIRKKVQEIFGREPICTINPDEVVALGAAVQANVLSGQSGEVLLLDVLPLSLGLETMGGVVSKILHRNTTIPVSATETFSTYMDGQTGVDIHVLQGERELVADNRSLARFQLKGLPPMPAGIPKLEIEFTVDANGILSVRAVELRTGKTSSITVNPSYGLNDAEVERMLMESFDHAESDFGKRFLIEAKVEAESLLRAAKKSFAASTTLIDSEERIKINAAVEALERSLSSTDYTLIKKEIENLNEATRPLAEKILNHAVATALKDKKLGDHV